MELRRYHAGQVGLAADGVTSGSVPRERAPGRRSKALPVTRSLTTNQTTTALRSLTLGGTPSLEPPMELQTNEVRSCPS